MFQGRCFMSYVEAIFVIAAGAVSLISAAVACARWVYRKNAAAKAENESRKAALETLAARVTKVESELESRRLRHWRT